MLELAAPTDFVISEFFPESFLAYLILAGYPEIQFTSSRTLWLLKEKIIVLQK